MFDDDDDRMFVGTYTNRVDRKLRVSVPARFRRMLDRKEGAAIVAVPIRGKPAAVCGDEALLKTMRADLYKKYPEPSQERARKERILFGGSQFMPFDDDGRIVLPKKLAEHIGVDGFAAFTGRGDRFEIWQPSALEIEVESSGDDDDDDLPY